MSNTTTSQWIASQPSYQSTSVTDPQGLYTFRTSFDLGNYDWDRYGFLLSLLITVDNALSDVLINGRSTGIVISNTYGNLWSLHGPFAISQGFRSGTNTLDFVVENEYSAQTRNPAGLRVEVFGRPTLGHLAIGHPSHTVGWWSTSNRSYRIDATTNLASGVWSACISNISWNGGFVSTNLSSDTPWIFFRVSEE
jgi:hypothetical protein